MRHQMVVLTVILLCAAAPASLATVLGFDDVPSASYVLTGSNYAGLTWEAGNAGYQGTTGYWYVPPPGLVTGHSDARYATNSYGSTLTGIGFPSPVDVQGVYVAGQTNGQNSTTALRVLGYHDGNLVATTSWFQDFDYTFNWLAMDFTNVNRIVFEAVPVIDGGGWFTIDDLTFKAVPEPASLALLAIGGLAIRRRCAA